MATPADLAFTQVESVECAFAVKGMPAADLKIAGVLICELLQTDFAERRVRTARVVGLIDEARKYGQNPQCR